MFLHFFLIQKKYAAIKNKIPLHKSFFISTVARADIFYIKIN